jgi:hypothetical protein
MFVFVVVGDKHVRAANIALRYLKHFTRSEIVVIKSRSTVKTQHDQVIEAEVPDQFDNHQASIYLKTSLPSVLGTIRGRFCYLDADVVAVSEAVDSIFGCTSGPVTFARDNVRIDMFSRHAVNCMCSDSTCNHLRESIFCDLGVDVGYCDWTLWNGGVFLFDQESADFFDVWHKFSRQSFTSSFWRTRDQGTLAATVWKLGLQDQPTLPRLFNFIVDRFWGIAVDKRSWIGPGQFHVWNDYSLHGSDHRPRPVLLHFVNGGVQQIGWHNWDEVAALLEPSVQHDLEVPNEEPHKRR